MFIAALTQVWSLPTINKRQVFSYESPSNSPIGYEYQQPSNAYLPIAPSNNGYFVAKSNNAPASTFFTAKTASEDFDPNKKYPIDIRTGELSFS